MPAPLTFRLKAGTVPSGQNCLSTVQDVLTKVEQFVTVDAPEGYQLVIIGSATPTSEQQSALWIRLNEDGTPFGAYVYLGTWLRVPPFPINTIVFFSGNVADIENGWHLADGTDGTPDLTAQAAYWEGGSPAGVNYNAANTSYVACPIVFVGLEA